MGNNIKFALISYVKSQIAEFEYRGFPTRLPIKTPKPAFVANTITENRDPSHSGKAGIAVSLIQFTIFASRDVDAEDLKTRLINLLDCYSGIMEGVKVYGCFLDGAGELFDENSMEIDEFAVSVDFLITWVT